MIVKDCNGVQIAPGHVLEYTTLKGQVRRGMVTVMRLNSITLRIPGLPGTADPVVPANGHGHGQVRGHGIGRDPEHLTCGREPDRGQ